MISCRKCYDFVDGSVGLRQSVDIYINNMTQNEKCSQAEYNRRLMVCDKCTKMVNGICSYCGCIILIRAMIKKKGCPRPIKDMWQE